MIKNILCSGNRFIVRSILRVKYLGGFDKKCTKTIFTPVYYYRNNLGSKCLCFWALKNIQELVGHNNLTLTDILLFWILPKANLVYLADGIII